MFIKLFNFSFFSVSGGGIDLDYCEFEWFALEMNIDHSVGFEISFKYHSLKQHEFLHSGRWWRREEQHVAIHGIMKGWI